MERLKRPSLGAPHEALPKRSVHRGGRRSTTAAGDPPRASVAFSLTPFRRPSREAEKNATDLPNPPQCLSLCSHAHLLLQFLRGYHGAIDVAGHPRSSDVPKARIIRGCVCPRFMQHVLGPSKAGACEAQGASRGNTAMDVQRSFLFFQKIFPHVFGSSEIVLGQAQRASRGMVSQKNPQRRSRCP